MNRCCGCSELSSGSIKDRDLGASAGLGFGVIGELSLALPPASCLTLSKSLTLPALQLLQL